MTGVGCQIGSCKPQDGLGITAYLVSRFPLLEPAIWEVLARHCQKTNWNYIRLRLLGITNKFVFVF